MRPLDSCKPKGSQTQIMDNQQQPISPPSAGLPNGKPQPGERSNFLMLLVIGFIVVCLSCSIIALAGLAGYNDGVRELDDNAESTRLADISAQYNLALTDVAIGNRELAALRLEHVVLTLGANVPNAAALLTQVKAVTPTPTATLTPTPSPTPENTATPMPSATAGIALPDPDALFAEVQSAMTLRDYETAVERINILQGLDLQYRKSEVDGMLHEALTTLSRRYLTDPTGDRLAEGILLAEQARAIAPIGELGYEAYVAGRYLDGLHAEGVECLLAVREWESIYAEAPQYRDVAERLGNSYAACGDAYTYQTEYCPAEQYYSWALGLINSSEVRARLDTAREQCANATPTPTPTPEGGFELTPTVEGVPAQ
jgi:tetratricopeptide (TPR) repeat protein